MTANKVPGEIFKLSVVTDNPLFEGFGLEKASSALGRASQREDMSPGFELSITNPRWKQARLKPTWSPPHVVGRVGSFNDFPGISMVLPAFSERACDVLRDLLEPNGELLPIQSKVGVPYFFYNITTVTDALVVEQSNCSWLQPFVKACNIDYFTFDENKLVGLSIFRIYEYPVATLVTGEFVRRVHAAGLNGFDFAKVWPLPRSVNWYTQEKTTVPSAKPSADLMRHALVVMLPLKEKKPNLEEKRAIKRLENELDAQLKVTSLDAPFFGWYEGNDKVPGEFRLFLSCPDADRLEEKLRPWLICLTWPVTIRVMKRYGDMHDPNARESLVHFNK